MSIVGLDIGTSHIKGAEIEKDRKGNYHLIRYGIVPSKDVSHLISSGEKKDQTAAAKIIREYWEHVGFKSNSVVCTLPEHKIFTKIITMPHLSDKEMKQAIEWEANQYLPQPLDQVYLQHTVMSKSAESNSQIGTFGDIAEKVKTAMPSSNGEDSGKSKDSNIDVLLVAAPKDLVNKHLVVLNEAGLFISGVEPASITTVRGITFNEVDIPSIVVNFGHNHLDFYLVVHNKVRFVRSVQFGVTSLVRAISESLDMPPIQANEYLYTYGFNESDLDGKITEIIKPPFDLVLQELKRFQTYVEKRISFNKEYDVPKVKRLVVVGGGALIPNLMVYLVGNVSLEVEFGDPWDIVNASLVKNRDGVANIGPLLVSAVGAAIK